MNLLEHTNQHLYLCLTIFPLLFFLLEVSLFVHVCTRLKFEMFGIFASPFAIPLSDILTLSVRQFSLFAFSFAIIAELFSLFSLRLDFFCLVFKVFLPSKLLRLEGPPPQLLYQWFELWFSPWDDSLFITPPNRCCFIEARFILMFLSPINYAVCSVSVDLY